MPLEALIRSLVKLSILNVFDSADSNNCVSLVVDKLKDTESLQKSR